jgi:hypothetical protein
MLREALRKLRPGRARALWGFKASTARGWTLWQPRARESRPSCGCILGDELDVRNSAQGHW